MAKELSRTFDTAHAAVFVNVLDNLGNTSVHTVYVVTTPDVEAAIAAILAATDAATDVIAAAFAAAGWVPGGNPTS